MSLRGFDMSRAREYIEPNSPEIQRLSSKLYTPQDMYYFVLENISYLLDSNIIFATDTLEIGEADCFGKSNLLASLLRAGGYPQERLRVVAGVVYVNREAGLIRVHAWVEFFDDEKGKWFVLDSTPLLDTAFFEKYEKEDYYSKFVHDVFFEYNDVYETVASPIAEDMVILKGGNDLSPMNDPPSLSAFFS